MPILSSKWSFCENVDHDHTTTKIPLSHENRHFQNLGGGSNIESVISQPGSLHLGVLVPEE
jgi:hypothetical protein